MDLTERHGAGSANEPAADRLAALSPDRRALFEKRLRAAHGAAPSHGSIPRRRRGEAVGLSFAQRRLWFLDQLAPGNPFYNIPLNMRLSIPVNVTALARSVNDIVRRHESLRTTFRSENGEPVQIVHDAAAIPEIALPVVDLRAIPAEEREAEARRLATLEAQQSFNLERGPLVRTTLIQLGDADFLFLLSIHHIVADGWSMGIISRELSTLYSAYALGWPARLPELPIQYPDFAVWQRQWLQGAVLDEQLAYWTHVLANLPTLQLATDRPRPPMQAFRGAYHAFSLDRELTEQLRTLSRAHGVTLFMTLVAAFTAVLHRYTSQTDIVIGSPIANRTRRELEPIIGFFVNSLVLRTDLTGDPTFAELLQRVREVALGAYAHQDLPFELLVEELQPSRDPSRNPLFQVTFQLFTPQTDNTITSDGATPVAIQRGTAIFDIAFTLIDAGGQLAGGFEYDTDLFDADTIDRMGRHMRTLLGGAVLEPERRISELPLLTQAERDQVLVQWNATAEIFPQRLLDELVADTAPCVPDVLAVIAPDGQLSYRELEARASRLAGHLQRIGVRRGAIVAVCLDRSTHMVVALLATLKAGAAYVPLDSSYPSQRLAFMLRDSGAGVLLAGRRADVAFEPDNCTVVALADDWDTIAASAPELKPVEAREPEDIAYVIYTSGSTGQPKGVAIPHRAIGNHMHWMQARFPLDESDRVIQRTPFSFDASVWEFYAPLLAGARLVLADPAGHKDPAYLVHAIREHEITVLQLVPSLLEMLLDQPDFDDTLPLRRVFCGGEALSSSLVKRFHARVKAELCNLYGPTEAAIDSVYWVSPRAQTPAAVPIGRPIANAEIYILDQHGRPVPIGVPGELHIGGAGLARGYLHRPDLTAARFIPHPFSGDAGARLYKSGDLARYHADGLIEFLGRLDHQVKLRGYRIELGEIETALAQHSGVREAVVVCREDQPGDRRLVAYVVRGGVASAESHSGVGYPQIDQWRLVFDETHRQHDAVDPAFNIVGWNSSYTGLPISAAEMHEAVDGTVDRLLALRPRRVLEVGCGTGLLLLRLAQGCDEYVGTDFSQVTLDGLETAVREAGLTNVRLLRQRADEVAAFGTETFDVIVLNSVVQYFPSAEYLAHVIGQLLPHVAPGGAIFVGDVRSLPLLDAFHASVELSLATPDVPAATLRRRVQRRAAQEQELVLAPEFFSALAAELTPIDHVEIAIKRGTHHNELTRFRYDVTLHTGRHVRPADFSLAEWPSGGLTADQLRMHLSEAAHGTVGFANVPNARVAEAVQVVSVLAAAGSATTVADIRAQIDERMSAAIDPEFFHDLAASLHGVASVQWAASGRADAFDVVLTSHSAVPPQFPLQPAPRGGYAAWANDPLQGAFVRDLVPDLRRHLQLRLPEYMVPADFMLVERLPLGPNGKIDRAQLPTPDPVRARQGTYIAPRSRIEERLARLWSEVLGVPHIGVRDNFFTELGGHSLLGTQLMSRVRAAFAIDLPLFRLFEAPTIAELAVHVTAADGHRTSVDGEAGVRGLHEAELIPIGHEQLSDADRQLIERAMLDNEDDRA